MLLSCSIAMLGLVNPYLAKLVIDKAYHNKDLKFFIVLLLAGAGVYIVNNVITGFNDYLSRYVKSRVNFDLRRAFFNKLQALPLNFFQDTSGGQSLFKLNYDTEQTAYFASDTVPQVFILFAKTLLTFAAIFYFDSKIAILALIVSPVLYLFPHYFAKRLRGILKAWVDDTERLFSGLEEVLTHFQVIKLFGRERFHRHGYVRGMINNFKLSLRSGKIEAVGSFMGNMINRAVLGLIILYGGYQVIRGHMSLGSITAVSIYLTQLSGLQDSYACFIQHLSLGQISSERLRAFLDSGCVVRGKEEAGFVKLESGRVEFRNINFAYRSDERFVLKDFSFCINGGDCVGIVGPSGCGKTTLLKLVLRLYEPASGQINIDGYPLNKINSASFHAQVSAALQETLLWNASVKDNILYGNPDAGMDEVIFAARLAEADRFISELKGGYEAHLGEFASKISEGQKQRIALARALIRRPRILILDEAMSCLDPATEEKIMHNIRNEFRRSTIIIVSHRAQTAQNTDLVFFFEGVSRILTGAHADLLGTSKKYAGFFANQSSEVAVGVTRQ